MSFFGLYVSSALNSFFKNNTKHETLLPLPIHTPNVYIFKSITSRSLASTEPWKAWPRVYKFQQTSRHFTSCNTHVTIATSNFCISSLSFSPSLRTYATVSPYRACCIVPWSFEPSGVLPAAPGVRLHSWYAQYWTNEVYGSPYKDQKEGSAL